MARTATPTTMVGIFLGENADAEELAGLGDLVEAKKPHYVVAVTSELVDGMFAAIEKDKNHALSEVLLSSVENKTPITLVVENSGMEDELGEMDVPFGRGEKALADISTVSFEQKGRGRTNVFRKASQVAEEGEESVVYVFGDVDEEHLEFAANSSDVLDSEGNPIFESDEEPEDEEGEGDEKDSDEDGEINLEDVDFDNLEEYDTDDLRLIAAEVGVENPEKRRRTTLIPAILEALEEGDGDEDEKPSAGSDEDDDEIIAAIVEGVTKALKPMFDKVIKAASSSASDNGTPKRGPGRPRKTEATEETPKKRGPGRPRKEEAAPAKRSLSRR